MSICLTLTRISSHAHWLSSSHKHRHPLPCTQRLTHTCMHTHTLWKSCFDQGSAALLEPHLAGFYGNSRLGWGILWCSTQVMQTDEWTVCSVRCLSQTQLSLLDGGWLWDAVVEQWQWWESGVVVTLLQIIFWAHWEQVWVSFYRGTMLYPQGTVCWCPDQRFPIIWVDKKPLICQIVSCAFSSYDL